MRLVNSGQLRAGIVSWRELRSAECDRKLYRAICSERHEGLGIDVRALLPHSARAGYLKSNEELATAHERWLPPETFKKEIKAASEALCRFFEKKHGTRIERNALSGVYIHDTRRVARAIVARKEVPEDVWARRVPAQGRLRAKPKVALVIDTAMGKVHRGDYLQRVGGLLVVLNRALSRLNFHFAAYTALRNDQSGQPRLLMTELVSGECFPSLSAFVVFLSREVYRLSLLSALNHTRNEEAVKALGITPIDGMYDFHSRDARGAIQIVWALQQPQWIIGAGDIGTLDNERCSVLNFSGNIELESIVEEIALWLR